MRFARVLLADTPAPLVALERDGCLYDVAALEERWSTRFAKADIAASDFHTRVVALGGAGLGELDARLIAGDRPSTARLLPSDFVWMPPCDDARHTYVQLEPASRDALAYRVGFARAIAAHDATVSFAFDEERPEARLDVGAMLREDLSSASTHDARGAILGFSLLNDWTGLDELERARALGGTGASARDRAKQLGPVLVTTDEATELVTRRAQLRVDGRVVFEGSLGLDVDALAASIARLSHVVDLHAGDVIGAGLDRARAVVPYGARVDLLVERLGRLSGRPSRGPL